VAERKEQGMGKQGGNNDRIQGSHSRRFIIIVLAAILVIAAGLRIYSLGSKSFWLDELIMRSYVGYDYHTLWTNPYLDGNISYPSIIQKFIFELLPENEFYMRLPTVLLSVISLLSIYLMGSSLYGATTGIAAALLLAFSFFHISMSQEFKLTYMATTTFYPMAIYSLFKGIERGHNRYWFLFIISLLSLLHLHFLTIPALFPLIAWICLLFILFLIKPAAYWEKVRGYTLSYKPFMKFAISLGLIFIGYLHVISLFRALLKSPYGLRGGTSSDGPFREGADAGFFFNLFKEYSGMGLLFLIFSVMILIWLFACIGKEKERFTGGFLLSCIILPFAAYWIANPSPPLYSRYFIYILPIYLLIVARGIVLFTDLFLKRWLIRNRARLYIPLIFALCINLFSCKPLWNYYHEGRTYYEDIALYLLNNIENKDIIFYADKDMFNIEGFLYYLDKFGKDRIFIVPQSFRHFPYPPYFFRPKDRKDLLKHGNGKKAVFLIYTGKKDVETWIKEVPPGRRLWFISDKEEPEPLRLGLEQVKNIQDNEKFFIYSGLRD